MMEYRIRHARVDVQMGSTHFLPERRWIAERRFWLFWCIPMWIPVIGAEWRSTEHAAHCDIEYDEKIRADLEPTVYLGGKKK